jgi:hypothetical protein
MLGTTLGWALVALGVAIALVPVLYGLHLTVVEEKLRHFRAAQELAIPAEKLSSCPSCGEHLNVAQLQFDTVASEGYSVAS